MFFSLEDIDDVADGSIGNAGSVAHAAQREWCNSVDRPHFKSKHPQTLTCDSCLVHPFPHPKPQVLGPLPTTSQPPPQPPQPSAESYGKNAWDSFQRSMSLQFGITPSELRKPEVPGRLLDLRGFLMTWAQYQLMDEGEHELLQQVRACDNVRRCLLRCVQIMRRWLGLCKSWFCASWLQLGPVPSTTGSSLMFSYVCFVFHITWCVDSRI